MILCRSLEHDRVELTFVVPADHPGQPVGVAGDFNEWEWQATPLVARGDHLEAVVVVPAGHRYAFRYYTAIGTWFNDDRADDYVVNEFGGVNCVVDVGRIARNGS